MRKVIDFLLGALWVGTYALLLRIFGILKRFEKKKRRGDMAA
jgi:hypothetical protein